MTSHQPFDPVLAGMLPAMPLAMAVGSPQSSSSTSSSSAPSESLSLRKKPGVAPQPVAVPVVVPSAVPSADAMPGLSTPLRPTPGFEPPKERKPRSSKKASSDSSVRGEKYTLSNLLRETDADDSAFSIPDEDSQKPGKSSSTEYTRSSQFSKIKQQPPTPSAKSSRLSKSEQQSSPPSARSAVPSGIDDPADDVPIPASPDFIPPPGDVQMDIADPSVVSEEREPSAARIKRKALAAHLYAEIAQAVAGRLGEEYYATLFTFPESEERKLALDRTLYAARAELLQAAVRSALAASSCPAPSGDASAIPTSPSMQQQMANFPMLAAAMGTGSQSSQMRYPGVSQRGPGVPPDDQFVPSSTLKANVDYAATLVSMQTNSSIAWSTIWKYGNMAVKGMFAELVALCISEAIPRKRGGINLKVRFTEIKERKQHILLLFNTLTAVFDDDGNARQLKFATDTRTSMPFIGRSGPTDFVEAAFDFVGYR